jgi:uncharacterized protein (DUF433 family)
MPRHPTSLRLSDSVAAELDRTAKRAGESRTRLVERYIDEGLRRDEHPLIDFRGSGSARRPALAGSRLDVWQVIATFKNSEKDVDATAKYFDIPVAHVRAAIRYYAQYKDEIDEYIERMHAAAEFAEAAWRREQEVLG